MRYKLICKDGCYPNQLPKEGIWNGRTFIITEITEKPSGAGIFFHGYLKGNKSSKMRFDLLDITFETCNN